MNILDPLLGKPVPLPSVPEPGKVIDAREQFELKRLADESRRNSDRIIAEARAVWDSAYSGRDSGDETRQAE